MNDQFWQKIILGILLTGTITPACADKIKNPTAVFAGLDKITGRIVSFEVAVGETVQFGALQMTPRVCYTRPATEEPKTTAFLEVDEITLSAERKRIFTGWMFAASPGLHGIEHPIYDIWLTDCKGGTEVIKETPRTAPDQEPEAEGESATTPQNLQQPPQQQPSPHRQAPRHNPREIIPEEPDDDGDDVYYEGQ